MVNSYYQLSIHTHNFIIAFNQAVVSLLLERVTFIARAKKVTKETPRALVLRMPSAGFGELTGMDPSP